MTRVSGGFAGSSTAPTPAPMAIGRPVRRLVLAYAQDATTIGTSRLLGLVGPAVIVLGRAPDAGGWTLDDRQASRSHARLTLDFGAASRALLEDLGSRNGTFVNGARVERTELVSGDVIRVGSHVFVYDEIPAQAVAGALELGARPPAILGEHPSLRDVLLRASKVAPLSEHALLLGESGTGKELFAAYLHAASGRKGSFLAVNCASVPEALADAELFGHERGAFTGAVAAREGLLAEADGGTLFLDEIGDAPASIQAKLLRVLESGEIRSVGQARARRIDVRVVAATNVDLELAVERGAFRGDLLARLAAHVIRLPPLRERRSDVIPLATRFLDASDANAFTPDAAEALLLSPFPRNVRELLQVVRHARTSTGGALPIDLVHLPAAVSAPLRRRATEADVTTRGARLLAVRRDVAPNAEELALVLEHFENNVSRAAEFFGKDRKQLYRWAEKLGIEL